LSVDHRAQMDEIYRLQRHFYDLTRKYYLLGRDRLIDELDLDGGGTVLEIGCGTGRNLIRAARRWPNAAFHGIDISEAMLETARRNVARAGLSDRIRLAQGDAAALDPQAAFGRSRFDRVVMSYTLSMIPPWREALAQASSIVAPGGQVAIVDFGGQEGLPDWWRRLLWAWLDRFHVHPRIDLPDAIAEIARRPGWSGHTRSVLRDYSRMATLSRA
jgi:S-adenosylmethionine-diacylgycerolhomoserine-N-methlytransferase